MGTGVGLGVGVIVGTGVEVDGTEVAVGTGDGVGGTGVVVGVGVAVGVGIKTGTIVGVGAGVGVKLGVGGTGVCRARLSTQPVTARSIPKFSRNRPTTSSERLILSTLFSESRKIHGRFRAIIAPMQQGGCRVATQE